MILGEEKKLLSEFKKWARQNYGVKRPPRGEVTAFYFDMRKEGTPFAGIMLEWSEVFGLLSDHELIE